jgi:hypothetical protein
MLLLLIEKATVFPVPASFQGQNRPLTDGIKLLECSQ